MSTTPSPTAIVIGIVAATLSVVPVAMTALVITFLLSATAGVLVFIFLRQWQLANPVTMALAGAICGYWFCGWMFRPEDQPGYNVLFSLSGAWAGISFWYGSRIKIRI